MAERIIAVICTWMCAVPFLVIGLCSKNSRTPLGFWSGDNTLKDKVGNIAEYNKEMSAHFTRFGLLLIIPVIASAILPLLGIVLECVFFVVGCILLHRSYKKCLEKYKK